MAYRYFVAGFHHAVHVFELPTIDEVIGIRESELADCSQTVQGPGPDMSHVAHVIALFGVRGDGDASMWGEQETVKLPSQWIDRRRSRRSTQISSCGRLANRYTCRAGATAPPALQCCPHPEATSSRSPVPGRN